MLGHALFFSHIRSSFLVPASRVPSCSLPPSADRLFPTDSRWTSGVTGNNPSCLLTPEIRGLFVSTI